MKKRKGTQATKLKKVAFRFISPATDVGERMYSRLRELVEAHHSELQNARIALAWNTQWKPDIDGHVTLGACLKVSDLQREVEEVNAYDFVLILRRESWEDPCFDDWRRRAVLDHQLCHCAVKLDVNGEPVVDECSRIVYRLKKHNIEDFSEVVERHGCYTSEHEEFARRLDRSRQRMKGRWIGYDQLHEQLRAVGLSVPIDAIVTWSDGERREASVWAEVRRTRRGMPVTEAIPAFLAAVAERQAPEPVQDTLPPIPPAGFPEPSEVVRS